MNGKKLLMAAAGVGVDPLYVENVFSTHLYEGNGSNQGIVNNIDLSTKGGMVWVKSRVVRSHTIMDSVRGTNSIIMPNTNGPAFSVGQYIGYNTNGFTIYNQNNDNYNGENYVSWTFRKAPNFFDVVTYTGNGTAGRTISHNLGTTVGSVWIKRTDSSAFWMVYHRGIHSSNPEYYHLSLNATFSTGDLGQSQSNPSNMWNQTAPTSTQITLGADSNVNGNGATYVAYVFAHNNNDGGFGLDADQDIIKCGEYTGDGGAGTTEINLGFEPQWILVKAHSAADNWFLIDNIRGWATHNNEANDAYLLPNASNSESTGGFLDITSTGFKTTLYSNVNVNSRKYIYIAIRRGPMAVPTSASDVFATDFARAAADNKKPEYRSGFPVDTRLTLYRSGGSSSYPAIGSRLTGNKYLVTATTAAENTWSEQDFDFMNGFMDTAASSINTTLLSYMWRRAPGYFDVVAYTGNGTTGTSINHNLGVVPEMMWMKDRDGTSNWFVYHKGVNGGVDPEDYHLRLNQDLAQQDSTAALNDTAPTASTFSTGTLMSTNAQKYVVFLFATLAGISKVGSYTGNGSTQTIDCGFSSGARFVLIKRTDTANSWFVFDSERGIVAGNDPYLQLNATSAEDELGGLDAIDPHSSGFIVNSNLSGINNNNGTFIFYAIA